MSATPPSLRTHPQVDQLLSTELFQSILVTHFHHWEGDAAGGLMPPPPPPPPNGRGDSSHRNQSNWNHNSSMPMEQQRQQQQQERGHVRTCCGPTSSHQSGQHHSHDEEEEDEESFDPPWPDQHEAFCALPVVQDHVVLEIAAGRNSRGRCVPPMVLPKGRDMKVILPGSLRERGEFCLVDVSFMRDPSPSASAAPVASLRARPFSALSASAAGGAGGGGHRARHPTSVASSSSKHGNQKAGIADDYRWRVRRTRFHCLDDFL